MSYRRDWMSDDQWRCTLLIADIFDGLHHIDVSKIKAAGDGVTLTTIHDFATYDFNKLTRAVVWAHDRCLRFELCGAGPRRMRMSVHPRLRESDSMSQRHPALEEHAEAIREYRVERQEQ